MDLKLNVKPSLHLSRFEKYEIKEINKIKYIIPVKENNSLTYVDTYVPDMLVDLLNIGKNRDMFDDSFEQLDFVFPEKFSTEQIAQVLQVYPQFFNPQDDQPQWFDRIKDLAQSIGWAREVKQFKQEPERYPGHCGDVSTIIRVALTGRTMTPNLYDICMLLGKERLTSRLNKVLTKLKLTQK